MTAADDALGRVPPAPRTLFCKQRLSPRVRDQRLTGERLSSREDMAPPSVSRALEVEW